jgi:hypothetical protein
MQNMYLTTRSNFGAEMEQRAGGLLSLVPMEIETET